MSNDSGTFTAYLPSIERADNSTGQDREMFRISKIGQTRVELSCKHVHIARRDPTEQLS
jgi:hypothetical protein